MTRLNPPAATSTSKKSRLAMLRVGADGRVIASNAAARALLGPVVGLPCHLAVQATEGGAKLCTATCVFDVNRGERSRDSRQVSVRGRLGRLVCTEAGGESLIAILTSAGERVVREALSYRERQVVCLVADGLTSEEIASRLGVKLSTVRTHVEHIRKKMGARTRAEAVARAMGSGDLD